MEEARLIDRSTLAPTRIVESYFYDAGWNLNRRTNNGVSSTFSVNTLNELTNAAGSAATYDASGNITALGVHSAYVYDYENRLAYWIHYQINSANPTYGDLKGIPWVPGYELQLYHHTVIQQFPAWFSPAAQKGAGIQ